MSNEYNYIALQGLHKIEQSIFREKLLESCRSQKEKDKWLDRWVQEDSAEKIAEAIKHLERLKKQYE